MNSSQLQTLILYTQKPKIISFLPELQKKLEKSHITYHSFIIHPSDMLTSQTLEEIQGLLPSTDFIICLGGDGTVLSAAKLLYESNIPILPMNFGQLGFIAENTEPEELDHFLEEIKSNSILKEQRTLLDISIHNERGIQHWLALNETYIGSNTHHKVGEFSVKVDEFQLSKYKSDGILVSTATGSTGYNLSAGGPILYPSLDVLLLTSVVPHKITHRPLVLPSHTKIKIALANEYSQNLIIDGQHKIEILPQDCILIQKSVHSLTLMYSSSRNYFKSLKEKLNWMV